MGRYYVHLCNVVDNILKIKLVIHLRFFHLLLAKRLSLAEQNINYL